MGPCLISLDLCRFPCFPVVHTAGHYLTPEKLCKRVIECREGGDIGLCITLDPKVL